MHRPVRLAFGVVASGLAATAAIGAVTFADAATVAATAAYPDLQTLPPRDLRFDRADVSADGSGDVHNVLRFSNTVYNDGDGPLRLRAQIDAATNSGPAYQQVADGSGGTTQLAAGSMYYHDVHSHYHYEGWGAYELWLKSDYDAWVAAGRKVNKARNVGTKTTSCVLDEEFISSRPGTPYPGVYRSSGCLKSSTNQLNEGLSVGWGDTYDYYRYEQWIDLGQSVLPNGEYVLRSVTDPGNVIHESPDKSDPARESALDNEGVTIFGVQDGALVDRNRPSGTAAINHIDAVTYSPNVTVTVIGRDDVSGVDQVRLSNDGITWKTLPYTGTGSKGADLSWNLTDAAAGGTAQDGTKTVHVQTRDRTGSWSATFTDTITLDATSSAYVSSVLSDAPAGFWRLGETSGTTAYDRSVTAVHGTYVNGPSLGAPGLVATDPGTAASFDGVDDHVSVPSRAALQPTAAVSLEAWIKPRSLPASGSYATILSKPSSYLLRLNGSQLEFRLTQAGGVTKRVLAPAGAVAVGRTAHVVGTYDGAALRLYVDGTQVASAPLTGAMTTNTSNVRIGTYSGTTSFLNGVIDDPAVYGKALSAARVQAHTTAGIGSGSVPQHTLSVLTAGAGGGTVESQPAGILCPGNTCDATFDEDTMVVLTATPSSTSTFTGWSGACTGRASCQVTMTGDRTVTATFSSSTYASAVAGDRPIGFWRLGDATGTRALDAAADPHHGTYAGGTALGSPGLIPSDPSNTAVTLDGVNDAVRVPVHAGKSPTGVVSLEAWITPRVIPATGAFASVFSKSGAYSLQFNGSRLEFTIIQSGGYRRRLQAAAGAVQAGRRYHVVGVYDGVAQRLYLNGALVASRAQTGAIVANNNAVHVGSWDGAKEFFGGVVDEVAIYSQGLSAARVKAHYDTAVAAAIP